MKLIGIVLIVIGLIWCLQGIGILGGSFMTGRSESLYTGIVTAAIGVALFAWTMSRRR